MTDESFSEHGPYPVAMDVEPPAHFDRMQVVLRAVLLLALAVIGVSLGWLLAVLYLALPVVAAVLISRKGGARYLAEDTPRIERVLSWVLGFFAYLLVLTDTFPMEVPAREPRLELRRQGGAPTVGATLLRLLTGIPSALVLVLLGIGSFVVWVVSMVWVLVDEGYPPSLYRYQRAVLLWLARLLAYLGAFVEPYPPFRLDFGGGTRFLPEGGDDRTRPPRAPAHHSGTP